ncbi:phospholipid transfer protein C2CD2L-like isoform X2 [Megalops cyprinoides]|uniref:phospholipid transfer protein C2CD2L-like isoform X2 n=1 Tax=Megalops cyprinoides TaxID=118141 RepID=UPI001865409D|nr:phospholipid transfer protein C2CD2L-like isoform X2 [Megalops cyprinoides]
MDVTMLEGVGWTLLVILFMLSLLTVLGWLVQYSFGFRNAGKSPWARVLARGAWSPLLKLQFGRGGRAASPGAGLQGLLSTLISFRSFRENCQRAWVRALNEQACRHGSSIQIAFESGLQLPPSASINHVTCMDQSAHTMVLQCTCTVDAVTFPVTVTQQSPAAVSMDTYHVTTAPVQVQLEVCLQEVEEEGLLVSWSFSQQPLLSLSVFPRRLQQEGDGEKVDLNMVGELVKDAIVSTQPAMFVNLKSYVPTPSAPAERQNRGADSPSLGTPLQRMLVRQLRVMGLSAGGQSAGTELCCSLGLDLPTQEKRTGFLPSPLRAGVDLEWDEDFTLDLDKDTKELRVRLVERNMKEEKFLPGRASVVLDVPHRTPIGRQVLPISAGPGLPSAATVTLELLFLDPGDPYRCQGVPVPQVCLEPAGGVEMDRTPTPDCSPVSSTPSPQPSPTPASRQGSTSCSPYKAQEAGRRALVPDGLHSNSSSPTSLQSHLSNGLDPAGVAQPGRTPTKRSTLRITVGSKGPLTASACCAASGDAALQGALSPGAGNCENSISQGAVRQDAVEATRSTEDVGSETGSTGALETRSLKEHKGSRSRRTPLSAAPMRTCPTWARVQSRGRSPEASPAASSSVSPSARAPRASPVLTLMPALTLMQLWTEKPAL